jgi:hypothetical protein
LIVLGDEGGYRALKFADAAEGYAPDPLSRNLRKEPRFVPALLAR